jgi:hypothetical protein
MNHRSVSFLIAQDDPEDRMLARDALSESGVGQYWFEIVELPTC